MSLLRGARAAFIDETGKVRLGGSHDYIISSVDPKKYPVIDHVYTNNDSAEAMQAAMITYGWAGIVNDEDTLMINFAPGMVASRVIPKLKMIVNEQAKEALKEQHDLEVWLVFAYDLNPEHNKEKMGLTAAQALNILDNRSRWKK